MNPFQQFARVVHDYRTIGLRVVLESSWYGARR